MMTGDTRGSVFRLLMWQWKLSLIFVVAGLAAAVLHDPAVLGLHFIKLPTTPLAVVGAALGIFVSFRTNSAYDRWWEGRKLWGRLINTSRHIASQAINYVSDRAVAEGVVRRHIVYVNVLRCSLRLQKLSDDDEMKRLESPERITWLESQSNPCHALLHEQLGDLTAQTDAEQLSEFRLADLDESVRHLLDIQGGCERIKKTPMPKGYGFIAERLIFYYGVLFPLAIVEDLGYWTAPVNLLVCLSFALISEAGRVIEDPFTMFWNGLPLSNISRMIEINLRQRLEDPEAEIPAAITADPRGILM